MVNLKAALMNMHDMTEAEADKEIAEARAELMDLIGEGEMPFDYCADRWGLEPDFLEDLIM